MRDAAIDYVRKHKPRLPEEIIQISLAWLEGYMDARKPRNTGIELPEFSYMASAWRIFLVDHYNYTDIFYQDLEPIICGYLEYHNRR